MVEAPSNRVFIVAISFLAVYAMLVGFMPPELLGVSQDFKNVGYDDFYDSSEIESFANAYTQNITYGGGWYSDAWGIDEDFGHAFFYVTKSTAVLNATWFMSNAHYDPFFFVIEWRTNVHLMTWTSKITGESFEAGITNVDFNKISELSEGVSFNFTLARFVVNCPHLSIHASVFYNSTAWDNSTHAWMNDDLHCEFAIEWDELGTGLNGWNLISAVVWFQAPDVHPFLNFLLGFPIWISMALIIFKIIMVVISVLPFT